MESIFPLIYCGLSKNNDTALLLSRDLLPPMRMNDYPSSQYDGCELDVFLGDNFRDIISNNLNKCLVTTEIELNSDRCIKRDVFLPSLKEVNKDIEHSFLCALTRYRDTHTYSFVRAACGLLDNNPHSYWLRTPYSASNFYCVSSIGNSNSNNAASSGSWLRPCFSVSLDAEVTPVVDFNHLYYELVGVETKRRTIQEDLFMRLMTL